MGWCLILSGKMVWWREDAQSSPDKNRKRAASSGGLFYEAMAASQEMQAETVAAMQAVQQTELLATIRQTNTALVTHGQMCTGMV